MEVVRTQVLRNTSRLKTDLKTFCTRAKELGAEDARILNAQGIASVGFPEGKRSLLVPDEEKSIHWPDPIYPNDSVEEAIARYRWAVIFRVGVDEGAQEEHKQLCPGSPQWQVHEKVFKITAMVESYCFYRGYHLAMGFASADCRIIYCHKERRCWAMIKGRACLHPYKARPSLEACGIDPNVIAEKAGWGKPPGSRRECMSEQNFITGLVLVV